MRVKLRLLIATLISVAILFATTPSRSNSATSQNANPKSLDLLIVNGQVVDGSGKKARKADVGIRGDRIVFVGDARKAKLEATRTIDATGMIVAPGFIDGHTHTLGDLSNEQTKSNQAYLMQGVTTVVTGNDGSSALNIGDTLRKWATQGIGTNAL